MRAARRWACTRRTESWRRSLLSQNWTTKLNCGGEEAKCGTIHESTQPRAHTHTLEMRFPQLEMLQEKHTHKKISPALRYLACEEDARENVELREARQEVAHPVRCVLLLLPRGGR